MSANSEQPVGFANVESRDREQLGVRLREARDYLGLSQEEVARSLGIPRSALSNIETGQRRVDALELKRLAELYKRPVGYFTGEAPVESGLPQDIAHLARAAAGLSDRDRQELSRFADYLRARAQAEQAENG
jgi:transcriptional regulator with XRE-family HTH domain